MVFFILVTFLTFLNICLFSVFSKRFFLFLKNVGKVQSGKQINELKHFQNNSNEIDL